MRRFLNRIGGIVFLATILFACTSPARAQVSNPANMNTLLCNGPVGAIAMRYPDRWRCLPPGAAGQLLQSGGPNAVGGWFTPSGTGNVQTDGNAAANAIPYFSTGTALAYDAPGGTPLDRLLGYTSSTGTGYVKRTGTGAYAAQAIPATDLPVLAAANIPAFAGNDCAIAAGTLAINCAGMLNQAHTYAQTQTFASGLISGARIVVYDGGSQAISGGLVSEVNGALQELAVNDTRIGTVSSGNQSGLFRFDSRPGFPIFQVYCGVPGAGGITTMCLSYDITNGMVMTHPLNVANGGTGQTAAGGAALDAILAPSGTGILNRTGTGAYAETALSPLLDAMAGTAQGSVLYRNASGWASLPPGTQGQVLTSQGSGANPTFASASAPPAGARQLLATLTASNSSILADTTHFTSAYTEYEIDLENVVPATTGNCTINLHYNGNYINASGSYKAIAAWGNDYGATGVNATTTGIPCSNINDGVASGGQGVTATYHFNLRSAVGLVAGTFAAQALNGPTTNEVGNVSAYLTSPVLIDGIAVTYTSGNIASGLVKIYGSN